MNFITQHAREHVWAEPIQDKDYYIRPARVTPNGGSFKYAELGMNSIGLPNVHLTNSEAYYHLYHIGQIPPHILGLDNVGNKWVTLDTIAAETECYVNIFLDNGYVVPRSQCYLKRVWPGKNIVLAIEHNLKANLGHTNQYDKVTNAAIRVPNNLNNQAINIRFYTNARYFATDRRDESTNPDNQMFFETAPLSQDLVNRIKANKDSPVKQGWFVVDGQIFNYDAVIASYPLLQGKEVSILRDETIITTQYFKLQDLKTFVSVKNKNIGKYLLDLNLPTDSLVYFNDVEYYLGKMVGGQFKGLCIPMLRGDSITTVTNKTHAIRTDVITSLMTSNDWMIDSDNVYIMAVIRQGGMLRGLIHQHTRIEELFKLPEKVVSSALTGVNALLNEWKASSLEKDAYATLIGADSKAIVENLVFDAYGYNAITRYHHPNPLRVEDYTTDDTGVLWYSVQLSNAASEMNKFLSLSTANIEIIEYNKDGLFLDRKRFPYFNAGLLVSRRGDSEDTRVALIEHYINSVDDSQLNLGEIYSTRIEDNELVAFGFAAYISTTPRSAVNPKWLDVTNLNTYFYLTDTVKADGSKVKTLVWNTALLNELNAVPMVRINNRSCFKTYNAKDLTKGYRNFPTITIPNTSTGKVQVEPGSIELWMENKLLIEDIDYIVKWPIIYIGRRIEDISTALIHLRLSGLANPKDNKHYKARETGFVKGGVLSVDGHYDIRNDRNIQINVRGSLHHRDEVSFDENKSTRSVLDGMPYQIKDYITPVELYTSRSTVIEKSKSEDIDNKVMGYLNEYLTTSGVDLPVINHTRHLVVSIFLDDIITRLKTGWLSAELNTPWTKDQLATWVKDVYYLLEVDIAYFETTNRDYIKLIPHGNATSINLTVNQYKFVNQVIDKYLAGRVQLNNIVTVS